MFEGIPTSVQLVFAALAALGGRELLAVGWKHYLGKTKSDAETDAIHSSITSQQLKDLKEAIALVGQMRTEMEQDKQVISDLKQEKIDDDRRIAGQKAVIDEQRLELRDLHRDMAELRINNTELERRVGQLEAELREITKENAQLKGMHENTVKNGELQ